MAALSCGPVSVRVRQSSGCKSAEPHVKEELKTSKSLSFCMASSSVMPTEATFGVLNTTLATRS